MPEIAADTTQAVLSNWPLAENAAFSRDDVIATVETAKAVVDVAAEAYDEQVADLDAALAELGVLAASNGHRRLFASPLARRLAREPGLSIDQLTGTGPNGRILRRDVERAKAAPQPAEAAAPRGLAQRAAFIDVTHTRLRKLIAVRRTESVTTAPHFSVRGSARVDRLLALRAELNEGAATRISINDLVVKAVAHAHLRGARDERDLGRGCRPGLLQQQELEGGSISVTNLGMYGTEEFAAIINPPQASILAVGAARQEPVVVDGRLLVATVLRLTLSVDHRPVDGVLAAQWMAALVTLLEHPARILA